MREVLRRGAQHRRAADVDHLDGLLLADAEAAGDVLERVEVHADEVEGRDVVLLERLTSPSLVAAGEDAAWMRGCSVLTRPPSISGTSVSSSTRVTSSPRLLEGDGGAAAGDELDAELGEAARERPPARPCGRRRAGRAQRAAQRRPISSRTTSGSSRCSTTWTRARSVSTCRPARPAPARRGSPRPCPRPRRRNGRSRAVSGTPAASTSSIGCAPGKAGSGAEWVLTIRPGKRSRNAGRSRCM